MKHKPERKATSAELLARFKAEGQISLPPFLQQMKPVSIILNWRKDNAWNGTILNSPKEKNSNSLHQQIRLQSLSCCE
jgi:hypothetical protein